MGVSVYQTQSHCVACTAQMDSLGDHAMNCNSGGQRTRRHNMIRDAVHKLAATAGINPRLEVVGLIPGHQERPADILLPSWDVTGSDMAIDVTIVNPTQPKYLSNAAHQQGVVIEGVK